MVAVIILSVFELDVERQMNLRNVMRLMKWGLIGKLNDATINSLVLMAVGRGPPVVCKPISGES